jgi:hypothetical protein
MQEGLVRGFRPAFYSTLPIFLVLYGLRLASGSYFALLPILVGLAAFAATFWHLTWALVAVRAWAALFILVGASLWLAVMVGGTSHLHSPVFAAVCTVMLVLGLYFWSYSKRALQRTSSAI